VDGDDRCQPSARTTREVTAQVRGTNHRGGRRRVSGRRVRKLRRGPPAGAPGPLRRRASPA
jgi:hypothetical protein